MCFRCSMCQAQWIMHSLADTIPVLLINPSGDCIYIRSGTVMRYGG